MASTLCSLAVTGCEVENAWPHLHGRCNSCLGQSLQESILFCTKRKCMGHQLQLCLNNPSCKSWDWRSIWLQWTLPRCLGIIQNHSVSQCSMHSSECSCNWLQNNIPCYCMCTFFSAGKIFLSSHYPHCPNFLFLVLHRQLPQSVTNNNKAGI